MEERFGKKEKLKSKTLITKLFTEGKSITRFPLKLIYIPIPNAPENAHKTGVSVPKRNFKRAVDRNYLKRLLREAYRKNKVLVHNSDSSFAFMIIYIGKSKIDYKKLFYTTEAILTSFRKKEIGDKGLF